jgi:hypothetical protein
MISFGKTDFEDIVLQVGMLTQHKNPRRCLLTYVTDIHRQKCSKGLIVSEDATIEPGRRCGDYIMFVEC